MSSLKKLIQNIHRRSVWRVLGIYAVTNLGLLPASAQEPPPAPGTGFTVLIDAAHHNVDRPESRTAVVEWLEENGYRIRVLDRPVDRAALQGVDLFISKNPLSAKNALTPASPAGEDEEREVAEAWRLPTPSAFSETEITILRAWVEAGGGLLLVVDHMPMPGAAEELAGAFGIEASNGFAVHEPSLEGLAAREVARAGGLVFRRADGSLGDHPFANGRGPAERIDSVVTYAGSAFRLPRDGHSVLTLGPSTVSLLPDVAWEFAKDTPRETVGGWSQGGVVRWGRGAVAIFGDGAVLVSPGMVADDDAPLQNPQFLLNAVHWLSGLIPD